MADSSISVSGPVAIQSDSKARVAYDLMTQISGWESVSESERGSREYWLELYSQCYKAVSGGSFPRTTQQSR